MTVRRGSRRLRVLGICAVAAVLVSVFAIAVPSAAAATSTLGPVTLEGKFRVVSVDDRAHSREEALLETAGHRVYHLRLSQASTVSPNTQVRVVGTLAGDTLTAQSLVPLDGGGTQTSSVTSPVAVSGTHHVLVMLVYWTAPDGLTPAAAESQVGGADNAWYDEVSYGQIHLDAVATPWMQITHTDCSLYGPGGWNDIMADAEAGARALGYDPSSYDHEMVYFPYANCGYLGLAYVSNRYIWINGVFDTRTTSHEIGHNLGLGHADTLFCRDLSSNQMTLSDLCEHNEGADALDTMGWGGAPPGHFNAFEKQRLGWMEGRMQTVSSDATVTLVPIEDRAPSGGSQGVIVDTPARDYWLEFRQPIGVDGFLDPYYPAMTDGVQIRVEGLTRYGPPDSELLDMRPGGDGSQFDSALARGSRFRTPDNVLITVNSTANTGATVTVDYDAPPDVYGWDQPAYAAYTDATRTTPVDLLSLNPGQSIWIVVSARNAGESSWLRDSPSPVLLGTEQPQDRPSRFFTWGWVGDNRPARLSEASVAAGDRGTFEFPVLVPDGRGIFSEHFNLVAEHEAWFPDIGVAITMAVNGPPAAPTVTETTSGDGWANLAWQAPADDGGSPITSYTVYATDTATQTPAGAPESVFGTATRASVRGLVNGSSYTFTVLATNAAGSGPASEPSNAVTPSTKSVSFVTTWNDADNARLLRASSTLHKTPARIQRIAVQQLADELRAKPLPGPTPLTPPSMTGLASYATSWSRGDQVDLVLVMRQYALTPREAQKIATLHYLDTHSY